MSKSFRRGTHRVIDPRETVARIRGLMPVLGITRLANLTGLDRVGIPTVAVCRPNSRSLAVAQGKGLTLAAAEASGLMEALEHFHAERVLLPLKRASLREMCTGHRTVEARWLANGESLFHDNLQILWVEGYDLLADEPIWLPLDLVDLDFTLRAVAGMSFVKSSNGLASGNHPLEALAHALCELLERDAHARFDLLERPRQGEKRLDLATVDDEDCRQALALFEAAEVAVAAWDITSRAAVPAFLCIAVDRHDQGRRLGAHLGMGCHPARSIALLRALTEAAQCRLTDISGARDDIHRAAQRVRSGRDVVARVREDVAESGGARDFRQLPDHDFETFDQEVAWLLERAAAAGAHRAIAFDLTHPALAVPVVKVVTPGLLHHPH